MVEKPEESTEIKDFGVNITFFEGYLAASRNVNNVVS